MPCVPTSLLLFVLLMLGRLGIGLLFWLYFFSFNGCSLFARSQCVHLSDRVFVFVRALISANSDSVNPFHFKVLFHLSFSLTLVEAPALALMDGALSDRALPGCLKFFFWRPRGLEATWALAGSFQCKYQGSQTKFTHWNDNCNYIDALQDHILETQSAASDAVVLCHVAVGGGRRLPRKSN